MLQSRRRWKWGQPQLIFGELDKGLDMNLSVVLCFVYLPVFGSMTVILLLDINLLTCPKQRYCLWFSMTTCSSFIMMNLLSERKWKKRSCYELEKVERLYLTDMNCQWSEKTQPHLKVQSLLVGGCLCIGVGTSRLANQTRIISFFLRAVSGPGPGRQDVLPGAMGG